VLLVQQVGGTLVTTLSSRVERAPADLDNRMVVQGRGRPSDPPADHRGIRIVAGGKPVGCDDEHR